MTYKSTSTYLREEDAGSRRQALSTKERADLREPLAQLLRYTREERVPAKEVVEHRWLHPDYDENILR